MYIIPGYVKKEHTEDSVHLTSGILENKVRIFQDGYEEELDEILNHGCSKISTNLTQFLYEQELLANESEIKSELDSYKKKLNRLLLLTIIPTQECNFRCPYCYENHEAVTMSEKTLTQIQKYIEEHISKFRILQINWFGGEPTLCKKHILHMRDFIWELEDRYDFTFQSNMTTNGYLLDIDSFRQYYDSGITNYQITLDGWTHDKTRPHVSGKGTLKTILKNLKDISQLPKSSYQYQLILRNNVLEDEQRFTWYDYIKELFGEDDRFKILVRPAEDWGCESTHCPNPAANETQDLIIKKHLEYLDKIGLTRINGEQSPFSHVCYANYPHSAVFRANGAIEKCTVCLDHPKNKLGYIDQDGNVVLDQEINDLWSISRIEKKCYQCPSVLSCLNMKCKKDMIVHGAPEKDCAYIMSDIY